MEMENRPPEGQLTEGQVTEPPRRHDRRRGGGLVGATILIAAGVVLLLNNLGILDWGVWEAILRLWPVLLIAAGLSVALGRRTIVGPAIAAALVLIAVGAAVWLYTGQYFNFTGDTTLITQEISQPLEGAQRAEVRIEFGAGELQVDALSESSNLIEGAVDIAGGEKLVRDFRVRGDTAQLNLRLGNERGFPFWGGWRGDARGWQLGLNRSVPMTLKIDAGVGKSTIDLSATRVTDLDLNTGVGQTTVTVPRQGRVRVRIDGGVGQVVVRIPDGVAARIRADAGIGGVNVSGDYQRQGDVYVSPGYDTAENRVELDVNGGVGQITFQQMKGL